MNFRVDRWRAVALRSSLVILTTVGALLLSSCGGSGQSGQSKRFKPTRMIVFGDEASLLSTQPPGTVTNAAKYTNNGFDQATNSTLDCRENRLWVQYLADEYSLVFAECNPANATATAQMRATAGAKVADLATAVDAFLAASAPVPTDLITMMVGTNDIVELYTSVSSSAITQNAAVAEAARRGELFGVQINRLTNSKNKQGRVMYSTVPEVGLTPFGVGKSLADQSLLNSLTTSFNNAMRSTVDINGRSNAFLDTAQRFRNIIDFVRKGKSVSNSNVTNVTVAACLDPVNLLTCTNNTLVSGATSTDHIWAGNINFSAAGHILIGNDAVDLATSLPL